MHITSSSSTIFVLILLAISLVAAGLQEKGDRTSSITRRHRTNRQTFHYPEELREHAQRLHPGTRIMHGTVARYAPSEWPAWFTRVLLRWDGQSRYGPYHPNDVRFTRYQNDRVKGS